MGLFGYLFGSSQAAEDNCPICGSALPSALMPFNGTQKLADGRICKACDAQVSPWLKNIKHLTVGEVAAHLQYRQQNYAALQYFNETHRIQEGGVTIALDWNRQQILFSTLADYRATNADIFTLPQITAVNYEINENHHTETKDLKDGNGPQHIPVYTYTFRFNITVNSPWFDHIDFNVNNRVSVNLTDQDAIYNCVTDGDKLYQFLSSIGFPSTFTDNTSCGVDSMRDGTALNRLMPPPPPVQPEPQSAPNMAMAGMAASVMMESSRREPKPVPDTEPKHPSQPQKHEQSGRQAQPQRPAQESMSGQGFQDSHRRDTAEPPHQQSHASHTTQGFYPENINDQGKARADMRRQDNRQTASVNVHGNEAKRPSQNDKPNEASPNGGRRSNAQPETTKQSSRQTQARPNENTHLQQQTEPGRQAQNNSRSGSVRGSEQNPFSTNARNTSSASARTVEARQPSSHGNEQKLSSANQTRENTDMRNPRPASNPGTRTNNSPNKNSGSDRRQDANNRPAHGSNGPGGPNGRGSGR